MEPIHILLVAPTPELEDSVVPCLLSEVPKLKVARDFHEAKIELDRNPAALLVTELKLGAYNGLHLAFRARDNDTRTIVLGGADVVLEQVAQNNGIGYLRTPVEFGRLREMARLALAERAGQATESTAHVVRDPAPKPGRTVARQPHTFNEVGRPRHDATA